MSGFGEVLRSYRVRRALPQGQVAALIQVSRATFTQWETNKHLPSLQRVRELDRILEAGGALVSAFEEARTRQPRARSHAPVLNPMSGPTVGQVLRDARRALLDQICFEDGSPVGWRHNLVPSIDGVSTLSTIYGLGALALLGGPDARTPAIVKRMMGIGVSPDGQIRGWKASMQSAPRMETTCSALNSLLLAGANLPFAEIVTCLRGLLDDTSRQRPFILTLALEPVLRLAPESAFAAELVELLLACRREFDGVLLWPEKGLERNQPWAEPSVAHTARAIAALRQAPADLVGDAVQIAEHWLAEQSNFDGVTEIVRRTFPHGNREEMAFHHFTSALALRALAGAAQPDRRSIERALGVVWSRYDPTLHLWSWSSGDVPVWQLMDAVAAVKDAAVALSTAPIFEGRV